MAQKQINNAQKNLAPIDAVVDALKEKFHKNEENTEDKEELTLLQWLQEIEESIKSREALLDAKENRWSKERIRYGMGSEGGLMKEVLEVLSEVSRVIHPQGCQNIVTWLYNLGNGVIRVHCIIHCFF